MALVGARSRAEAAGTFRQWFRAHLAARHAQTRGQVITEFFDSLLEHVVARRWRGGGSRTMHR